MTPRPIDPARVETHLAAAARCLAELEKMSAFAPERFDDAREFPTAVLARALLRETLESTLALGRHLLARRHGIAVTEYREVAAALNHAGDVPRDLHAEFASFARLRNRLTHAYLAVEPAEIHDLVAHRLPRLHRLLHALAAAAGLDPNTDTRGGSEAREKGPRYRKTRKPAGAKRTTTTTTTTTKARARGKVKR
jgi:uncharacterized protein YutE (UPF0331/DUF86 family)